MGIPIANLGKLAARLGASLAAEATTTITVTTGGVAGAYDPEADSVTITGATETVVPDAIEYQRKHGEGPNTEIAEKKFATQTKVFLIRSEQLPANAEITRETPITQAGKRWFVLAAQKDPSGATWIVDVGR